MATSIIPAAKAALKATLDTALAGQGVAVFYGLPYTNRPNELVAVANARESQEPRSLGNVSRTSNAELDIVVSVSYGGGDGQQQVVTERAFAVLALVEAALRSDPTLGSTVIAAQPGEIELVETDDEEAAAAGRFADITVTVLVAARL